MPAAIAALKALALRLDRRLRAVLLFCLTSLLSNLALAMPGAVELTAGPGSFSVWPHIDIYEDAQASMEPEQIAAQPESAWQRLPKQHSHYGPRSSALWARFTLHNSDIDRLRWFVVQEQTFVDDVRLYQLDTQGIWRRLPGLRDNSGGWFGGARNPAFEVSLPAGVPVQFMARTQTLSLQRFPLAVYSASFYQRSERMSYMASGFVLAVPLAVAIFVLMLWRVQRQRGLLIITGLILTEMVGAAWVGGVLYSVAPWVDPRKLGYVGMASWILTICLGYVHARIFLNLDADAPRLARLFRTVPWLLGLFIAFEFAGSGQGRNLVIYTAFASLLMFFGAAVWQARRSLPYAWVYALAWGTYLASVSLIVINLQTTIPPNASNIMLFTQGSIVSLLFAIAAVGQVRENDLRTRAALDRSRARNEALQEFQLLFDNASVGLYRATSGGTILRANQSLAKMHGFDSARAFAGNAHPRNQLWHARPETLKTLLDRLEAQGAILGHEYDAQREDLRVVENARIAERQPDGSFVYDGAVQDISLRYRMEEQLREANAAVRHAMADRLRLFSATNHDLRQPLQSLGLFIELAAGRTQDSQVQQWLVQMRACYLSLSDTLDGLLALSRLEAGAVQAKQEVFALDELLAALGAEYGEVAAAKSLGFSVHSTTAMVRSDRALLERILRNLISNAIRYTPKGRVLIGVRRRGEHLGIQVLDTGMGIEPEARKRIFEEFEQSRSGKQQSEGIGLGLAIVKGMADLLELPLILSSTPGKGSCFEVQVPLAKGPTEEIRAVPALQARQLDGVKLLIIDDDADIRTALIEWLGEQGAQAHAVPGSERALQFVQDGNLPDALILDYRLQGETGPQVHQLLVARCGLACPVLVITAEQVTVTLAGNPPHQVLRKPVNPDKLIAALCELLNLG